MVICIINTCMWDIRRAGTYVTTMAVLVMCDIKIFNITI